MERRPMTHKEAVEKASRYAAMIPIPDAEDLTEFLRAYIEARGLVMVQREPEFDMVWAGLGPERKHVRDTWRAMLAAAPDPFEEGE